MPHQSSPRERWAPWPPIVRRHGAAVLSNTRSKNTKGERGMNKPLKIPTVDALQASTVDYGTEEAAMQAYLRDGERRAHALGNRGPIRFAADGGLHPDIVE